MRNTFLAAAIAVASLVGVGCANNKDEMSGSGGKSMGADACAMCAGHQTATASGTCPMCNMKVDKMKSGSMQKSSGASSDACPKCPGTQTLTADGTCPMCAGKSM